MRVCKCKQGGGSAKKSQRQNKRLVSGCGITKAHLRRHCSPIDPGTRCTGRESQQQRRQGAVGALRDEIAHS